MINLRDESGRLLTMDEIQKRLLMEAMKEADSNTGKAAELMQVSRKTVYNWLKRYRDRPANYQR